MIAAGSLLEHALSAVKSLPVGRVEYLYVFPMSFAEFLMAHEMHNLLERIEDNVPIDSTTARVAMNWFHKYTMVGGMPEIVQQYVKDEALNQLPRFYESIWTSYKDDVVKYAENKTEEKVIKHLMNTAPLYLDSRITFQGFGKSNYRSREVGESFRALDDAKIIQLIYPSTDTEFPLVTDYRKSPRLQFLDTGLLNHALNLHSSLVGIHDLSTAYKGALLPHIITQELIAQQDYNYTKPNFWVRQKKTAQAEVDLIYVHDGLIIPIEIKSGKAGKLRSLHQFIEAAPHGYAVRMYAGEFRVESHETPGGKAYTLMNLPYCLMGQINTYLDYFLQNY